MEYKTKMQEAQMDLQKQLQAAKKVRSDIILTCNIHFYLQGYVFALVCLSVSRISQKFVNESF